MTKKSARLEIRINPKDKAELQEQAIHLGFVEGKGVPNFSRFCRWIFMNGNRPIGREQYNELIRLNQNLIRYGGLLNQYLYHLNRERKILLDKGIEENNKKYLETLGKQNQQLNEIKILLLEMRKISEKIYILENA